MDRSSILRASTNGNAALRQTMAQGRFLVPAGRRSLGSGSAGLVRRAGGPVAL